VVWFRHDLRLGDNPAWAAASAGHDRETYPEPMVDHLMARQRALGAYAKAR
jgi:deoxyribodipyrimidine photolyase